MVISTGLDGKMDRNFIEERRRNSLGAEVVADGEQQLIVAGKRVGEKRGIAAAIGVGDGFGEQFTVARWRRMRTPWAGLPETVSRTCVVSFPIG